MRPLLPVLSFLVLVHASVLTPGISAAAWEPTGADLSRPRILFRPGDEDAIRSRLGREPYRSWLVRIAEQLGSSTSLPLGDDTIAGERIQSNHAKHAAFLYALDRTLVDGRAAPFPSAAARKAMGDRARDLLLTMYGRSRIPAQFDDDINSSEEMINYATAYDLLAGAGYDFEGSEPAIRAKLVAFASEFYSHFLYPELAGSNPFETTDKLVNNHLSKSASALGVAAIVLAEHTPPPGSDPTQIGDPAHWMAWALERLDTVLRFTFVTGDGGYGEGPYYARYAAQNHLPFLRALDRVAGPGPFAARDGAVVPNLWRDPLFARLQRWLVDHTLPDGTLAPLDDGNPGKSYYFALLSHLADAPLHHWMAARTATPFESEGSIYLSADMIVAYDDGIAPVAPRDGEARFYPEGGTAVFRSDFSRDAVMAIANAEHGAALELGRDRNGRGQTGSASHEHAEPGSFLLHAFGERLVLDPGYLSFPQRALVAKPEDHGIVLVDGQGPKDPFIASVVWAFEPGGLLGPAPVDGEASLVAPLDTGFLDAARVVSRYGQPAARFERTFLFADHRYLIAADTLDGRTGSPRTFTWLLHGNGGGSSDGSFLPLPLGGRWTRGAARLDAVFAAAGATPGFSTSVSNHEDRPNELRTHAVLRASVSAPHARSVWIVYPSRGRDAAPLASLVDLPGTGALALVDAAEDRRVLALHRASGLPPAVVDAPELRRLASDGSLVLVDARSDGALRLAFAEDASELAYDGVALRAGARGRLGVRPEATRAELVATASGVAVEVSGLAFTPRAADGACAVEPGANGFARVRTGRSGTVVLRADAGNSAPSADPGPTRAAWPGSPVSLSARASCDVDGDALTARWELVSAPAGSAGRLRDADSSSPTLAVDVPGPYRVRLMVTDAHGAASRPADLLVLAGTQCANGLDDDLDGLFDGLDDRCGATDGASECGLLGIEGAFGAALALAARRRARRPAAAVYG